MIISHVVFLVDTRCPRCESTRKPKHNNDAEQWRVVAELRAACKAVAHNIKSFNTKHTDTHKQKTYHSKGETTSTPLLQEALADTRLDEDEHLQRHRLLLLLHVFMFGCVCSVVLLVHQRVLRTRLTTTNTDAPPDFSGTSLKPTAKLPRSHDAK